MKPFRLLSFVLLAFASFVIVVGCGDSGGPDPKVEQVRMDAAVEMRKLFDKAGGDYSKLDTADKASFEKLAGGASAAEQTWTSMKNGPGAAPSAPPSP